MGLATSSISGEMVYPATNDFPKGLQDTYFAVLPSIWIFRAVWLLLVLAATSGGHDTLLWGFSCAEVWKFLEHLAATACEKDLEASGMLKKDT